MRKPLKKINIAGIWTIDVHVEMHAEARAQIDEYLMELNEAISHAAIKIGNRPKHKLNVKSVSTSVHVGR